MRERVLSHSELPYSVRCPTDSEVANTFSDTTSPVASKLQLRIHLAIIAHRLYHCVQMDLTNAYLHADIQDVVFIFIPSGFPGAGEVALLEKGLYGTKQGSR